MMNFNEIILENETYDDIKSHYEANPANIYLLKVLSRNTRKMSEICSKLTMKTVEQHH